MDLTGSLIDTNLRIYPTKQLLDFLIASEDDLPTNLQKIVFGDVSDNTQTEKQESIAKKPIQLNDEDIKNLNRIRNLVIIDTNDNSEETDEVENKNDDEDTQIADTKYDKTPSKELCKEKTTNASGNNDKDINDCKELLEHKFEEKENKSDDNFLTTSDIDWLYNYVHERRGNGEKNVPFLHDLLKGVQVEMPNNKVITRNPVLEARCVKLRSQQEAREYRKMTRGVDNVRMRFPDDSISYQLKQVNRQLIAIGQFIISIFAGFLFGFRGVEWMVGNLDFGFRLLLGVMCALVIALAEIYFLAKKLNEELNIPETIQLGGPPVFADDPYHTYTMPNKAIEKEHKD